ncbi:MAG TPA: monovalent cation/H+ antiporter complex subunit F [Actinophytocola sp.]|jgi:multisubunit Na+/H+ antiporter MnhF subunit|uniref:monovalent cation/H+ antiporter complex subunit F n=1 Tax=Actinophytocola sp. TaxID=1872138 RepID=UPI002F92D8D5
MTGLVPAFVLMIGGLVPGLVLVSRGDAVARLIGLQLLSCVAVLVLLLLAQGFGQSQYLIVPLVLVVLAFAGTLVFTRLLGRRP